MTNGFNHWNSEVGKLASKNESLSFFAISQAAMLRIGEVEDAQRVDELITIVAKIKQS